MPGLACIAGRLVKQVVAVAGAARLAAVVRFATLLIPDRVTAPLVIASRVGGVRVGVHRRVEDCVAIGTAFRAAMLEVRAACFIPSGSDVHAVFI